MHLAEDGAILVGADADSGVVQTRVAAGIDSDTSWTSFFIWFSLPIPELAVIMLSTTTDS